MWIIRNWRLPIVRDHISISTHLYTGDIALIIPAILLSKVGLATPAPALPQQPRIFDIRILNQINILAILILIVHCPARRLRLSLRHFPNKYLRTASIHPLRSRWRLLNAAALASFHLCFEGPLQTVERHLVDRVCILFKNFTLRDHFLVQYFLGFIWMRYIGRPALRNLFHFHCLSFLRGQLVNLFDLSTSILRA